MVAHAIGSKKRTATSVAKIYGPGDELLAEADAILVNVPEDVIAGVDLDELGWRIYTERSKP